MPTTLSTVVLTSKGECRKANLALTADGSLTPDAIQKFIKKKEHPEQVARYDMDHYHLTLFGYKTGKKGTENKTELPFPHSETVLYGDVVVIASLTIWQQPIPFTTDQWTTFYQKMGEEKEDKEDQDQDQEDEDEDGDEVESVKDDFDESDAIEDEEVVNVEEMAEEEEEPEPEILPKRKRAPVFPKVDPAALKEEIPRNATPDTHPIREMCIRNLSFLQEHFTTEQIIALEQSIYETIWDTSQIQYIPRNWKIPSFCEAYRQMVQSVLSNLHPQSPVQNTRLLHRILEGEFPLHAIPTMSSYEMFPENWFMMKDKLLQREQKILEGNRSRATDQFKCRRCQKKECTYYELQTRSADEPMTIFITCLNCGKEWRQGG
jgi:hypothetical protein